MPETTPAVPKTELLAYAGLRPTSKGGYAHFWVAEGDEHEMLRIGAKKHFVAFARIGQLFEITVEGSNYFIAGEKGPRYAGRSVDTTLAAKWEAIDRATRTLQTQAQRAKRDGETSALDAALAPIAAAMRATNQQGRDAILAYVVSRLTRYYERIGA